MAIDPLDTSKLAAAVWVVNNPSLPAPTPPGLPASRVLDRFRADLVLDIQRWPGLAGSGRLLRHRFCPLCAADQSQRRLELDGNFYVLESQHNSGGTSGVIVLEKYNFLGASPTTVSLSNSRPSYSPYFGLPTNYNVLYQWVSTSDAAVYPTMLVDNNVARAYRSDHKQRPERPVRKDQYESQPWALQRYLRRVGPASNIKPSLVTDLAHYNPNRIKAVVSSDGGNNFTGKAIADAGNFGVQPNSQPQLVVDQNSGQVTIAWNDFGTLGPASGASPPQSLLMSNTISPGLDSSLPERRRPADPRRNGNQRGGSVHREHPVRPAPRPEQPDRHHSPVTDQTLGDLSIVLQAPNGSQLTLVTNQNNATGTANTGIGISGANLGITGLTTNPFFPGSLSGRPSIRARPAASSTPTQGGTNAIATRSSATSVRNSVA